MGSDDLTADAPAPRDPGTEDDPDEDHRLSGDPRPPTYDALVGDARLSLCTNDDLDLDASEPDVAVADALVGSARPPSDDADDRNWREDIDAPDLKLAPSSGDDDDEDDRCCLGLLVSGLAAVGESRCRRCCSWLVRRRKDGVGTDDRCKAKSLSKKGDGFRLGLSNEDAGFPSVERSDELIFKPWFFAGVEFEPRWFFRLNSSSVLAAAGGTDPDSEPETILDSSSGEKFFRSSSLGFLFLGMFSSNGMCSTSHSLDPSSVLCPPLIRVPDGMHSIPCSWAGTCSTPWNSDGMLSGPDISSVPSPSVICPCPSWLSVLFS